MTDKEQREAEYAAMAEESKAFGLWLADLIFPISLAGRSLDGACVVPEEVDQNHFCMIDDLGVRVETGATIYSVSDLCENRWHSVETSWYTLGFRPSLTTVIGGTK